jgi:hypothetical protein
MGEGRDVVAGCEIPGGDFGGPMFGFVGLVA